MDVLLKTKVKPLWTIFRVGVFIMLEMEGLMTNIGIKELL